MVLDSFASSYNHCQYIDYLQHQSRCDATVCIVHSAYSQYGVVFPVALSMKASNSDSSNKKDDLAANPKLVLGFPQLWNQSRTMDLLCACSTFCVALTVPKVAPVVSAL
eukprot:5174552-Amphidinium_carterae.1